MQAELWRRGLVGRWGTTCSGAAARASPRGSSVSVAESGLLLEVEQSDRWGRRNAVCRRVAVPCALAGSPAWCVGTQVCVQDRTVVYGRESIGGRAEATAAAAATAEWARQAGLTWAGGYRQSW
jgi:hypothetical protein